MKTRNVFSFTTLFALFALSLSFCGGKAANKVEEVMNADGFAVVELFTSEGCSSCPPADEAMIDLAKEFPEHVYFLGYHVDYWDYIGWKDPFSNPDFTKRQNRYAEVFGLNSIYTPQAIVNGERELVGSKETQLKSIINEELKTAAGGMIELSAKKIDGDNIKVSYKVGNTTGSALNIALVQQMATSEVKRGENHGRKLNHINIVRSLQTVKINKDPNAHADFKIPAGLSSNDLKVIAFVQDEKNLKIRSAAGARIE